MKNSTNSKIFINKNKRELIGVGYYKAPKGKPITPRIIPKKIEYLEILTNGFVFFKPDKSKEEIKFGCGTMFWHIPGDYTICKADQNEPYECLCVTFKVSNNKPFREFPRVSIWQNNDELLNFSDLILQSYHSNILDKNIINHYVLAKVSWEARLFEKKSYLLNLPSNIQKLRLFVKENFQKNISIQTLAEIAELSPAHLHVLTKKFFNKTPHELILERRLSEARKLLLKTKKTIKEIAEECGFPNIETFYRAFSRKFKITPAKMRSENDPMKLLLNA